MAAHPLRPDRKNADMNLLSSRFASRAGLIPTILAFAGCGGGLDPILGTASFGVAPTATAASPVAAAPAVTGHTARLGYPADKPRLSAQRAEALKAYRVSSGGVQGPRITAVGNGEAAPVTQDCIGSQPTPKLIACLQPERRVEAEVEVTGMR